MCDVISECPSRTKLGDHVVAVIVDDVAVVKLEDVGVVEASEVGYLTDDHMELLHGLGAKLFDGNDVAVVRTCPIDLPVAALSQRLDQLVALRELLLTYLDEFLLVAVLLEPHSLAAT